MRAAFITCLLISFTMFGCDSESEVESTSCSSKSDCMNEDLPQVSIWYPTCSGDVLQTPTGTGEPICQEDGMCGVDLTVSERDCAAEGKLCAMNPTEGTQGDACVEIPPIG